MKINPIPAQGMSSVPEGLRTLTMKTNATPLSAAEELGDPSLGNPETPIAKQVENKDNNSTADSESEATQPISSQYAMLRKAQRAAQVKEADLLSREKELASKFNENDFVPVSLLKQNGVLKTLLDRGLTSYEDLTQEILNNQGNPEISQLKAELKALKEGVDSKFTEATTQQREHALAQFTKDASRMVDEGGDAYALVKQDKAVPKVIDLIAKYYDKTGETLSVKDALDRFEAQLEADWLERASIAKIKAKLMPQPALGQRHEGMRTLTNRDTATPPMTSKQRALAAFYGRPVA